MGGRTGEFHVAESRRRGEILVTSNHQEFKHEFGLLRKQPGAVVLVSGAWTNTEDPLGGIEYLCGGCSPQAVAGEPVCGLRQSHAGVILFRLGGDTELATKIERPEYVLSHHAHELDQFLVVTHRRVRVRRG